MMRDTDKNLGRTANRLIALTITIVFSETLNDDKNDEKRQTQISSVQFKFLFTEALSKQSERGASFSTERH